MPYKNPEDRRRSNRESYERNKESRLKKHAEWKANNKDRIKEMDYYTSDEAREKVNEWAGAYLARSGGGDQFGKLPAWQIG